MSDNIEVELNKYVDWLVGENKHKLRKRVTNDNYARCDIKLYEPQIYGIISLRIFKEGRDEVRVAFDRCKDKLKYFGLGPGINDLSFLIDVSDINKETLSKMYKITSGYYSFGFDDNRFYHYKNGAFVLKLRV